MTKKIMLLGTGSSVGKSTLATAFCRYFKNKGFEVAPYKALNISLNSFVTLEGDEIARSQVVQAEACKIEPKEYMNPILMKPAGDKTQVIVRGRVNTLIDPYKKEEINEFLKIKALEAFKFMEDKYEIIVLEGSGGCAEINLKDTDIANMYMANKVDAKVILVADIEKGGVFASIVGTIALLTEEEKARVKGIIINKFRGNPEYFKEGVKQIENLTGIKVLGVLPYNKFDIEEEDSAIETMNKEKTEGEIDVAVIKLPHMSNFTDLTSLDRIEGISVRYVEQVEELKGADFIIIPGSKNTIKDLQYLKNNKFNVGIHDARGAGAKILGICGGFQMLGQWIKDPFEVEGSVLEEKGLGLLSLGTIFSENKITKRVSLRDNYGNSITGYEIHNGEGISLNDEEVWIRDENGVVLGMRSTDETIYGTYIHGLFDDGDFLEHIFKKFNKEFKKEKYITYKEYKDLEYDKLTGHLEKYIDMEYVEKEILK